VASAATLTPLGQHQNAVLVDVTSLIGAEEFILAQNNRRPIGDPFGRQCFVEIIQSLIFMSRIYVAHPILAVPRDIDFGEQPRLLRALLSKGLVTALHLDKSSWDTAKTLEAAALRDLQSPDGISSVMQFISQAQLCDEAHSRSDSLSARVRGWSEFQAAQVYGIPGHHGARIQTSDGIEEDAFGEWARSAAVVLHGMLERISAPGRESLLAALLARGIKYRARAAAADLSYQSHPMRRDFLLTFELTRGGADTAFILDVIKVVRGIHASLLAAGGESFDARLQILELELPLLGGRLWSSSDIGKRPDSDWIEFVVDKIAEYRVRAQDMRTAIENCVTAEDYLRLARDIEAVQQKLLERLGLRAVELSPVERELVDGVASVTQAIPGVPKVSGLWIGARSVEKRYVFAGEPFQRFLYKEFVRAWKRAGK
jgi:hypothetical protein